MNFPTSNPVTFIREMGIPPGDKSFSAAAPKLSQLLNLTAETVRYQRLEKPAYLIERERKTLEPLGINKREEM